jgi:hypothetical protein
MSFYELMVKMEENRIMEEFSFRRFGLGALGTLVAMSPLVYAAARHHSTPSSSQTSSLSQPDEKRALSADESQPESQPESQVEPEIAWGSKVSPEFKSKVIAISKELGLNPDYLMACMAFETGQTFSPSVKNPTGSATGLIQFMSYTASNLGTTTKELAAMTPEQQLDYVRAYLLPYAGKLHTLEDTYMAILYPAAIGKPYKHIMKAGTKAYKQNKGLDVNKDGIITPVEATTKVQKMLQLGMQFAG